jgi:predicted Zn-dependent protease
MEIIMVNDGSLFYDKQLSTQYPHSIFQVFREARAAGVEYTLIIRNLQPGVVTHRSDVTLPYGTTEDDVRTALINNIKAR